VATNPCSGSWGWWVSGGGGRPGGGNPERFRDTKPAVIRALCAEAPPPAFRDARAIERQRASDKEPAEGSRPPAGATPAQVQVAS
jgi:hypothetical protein